MSELARHLQREARLGDFFERNFAVGEAEIGRATSELQSQLTISYAVFCLKKKKNSYIIAN